MADSLFATIWQQSRVIQPNIVLQLPKYSVFLTIQPEHLNIARGTTDPEIDSMTTNCKVGHQMAPLGSVLHLTWHLAKL